MKHFRVVLLVGFLAGVVLGVVSSGPGQTAAQAVTEAVILRVHPGPIATNGYLTCSWHGACTTPPAPGSALDWANGPNTDVRWRSRAWRSAGTGPVASGLILHDATGVCTAVLVQVTDVFSFPKGHIRYSHTGTWTPGWSFTIGGAPSSSVTDIVVGFTLASEAPQCVASGWWTGPHLHQDRVGSWWAVNWGNFLAAGSTYPVLAPSSWQYEQSWTWSY